MIITAIEPQKRRPNRRSVFVDGVFAFGLHEEEVAQLKLTSGMEITREQLNKMLTQVVYVNARDTALRYLGSRARTAREIIKRLEEDAYPPEIIARVMALLKKYRYIDDKQYALDYALSRMKNGKYGSYRVKQELKMRGIREEYIENALRQSGEEWDAVNGALSWLNRKQPDANDRAQKKRVTDALLRKGFSYDTIKEAFELYENESDD